MDEDLKEKTIRLVLCNQLKQNLSFFLEPEGKNLILPADTEFEVVIRQKEEKIFIIFQHDEDPYFVIETGDLPDVYHAGKRIH